MIFSPEEELMIFLSSILTGVILPVFYDILSICTKRQSCHIFVYHILDAIAVAVTCAVLFCMTLSVSRGIIRLFEFSGLLIGAFLYKLLLSKFFCVVFGKITDIFCTFFKLFFKILLTPIEFMYKISIKCINGLLYPFLWFGRRIIASCSRVLPTHRRTRNKT